MTVSKVLYVIYCARGIFQLTHRLEKSSSVCLPLCLFRFLEDMGKKTKKAVWDFFFLTNSCIAQLHYQLEMRLVRLSTLGLSTNAGQNSEIPLGSIVTLGTIKCNESRTMAQGGFSNEILVRAWCGLGFCLGCSFQVFLFLSHCFKTKQNIAPTLTLARFQAPLPSPFVFRKLQMTSSFFCLKWI